ncbi:MAG: uroporphyrinogen decarboxylase family protein [Verrucomicrobiota bacterium]
MATQPILETTETDLPGPAFNRMVLESPRRLVMPIAVYPALALTGGTVRDVVNHPRAQFDTQAALHERFQTPVVMTAMDLSAEAEAFGATIRMSETEIPSVTGRLVTGRKEVDRLAIPMPGAARTSVYLQTVRMLSSFREKPHPLVLAGCIGPFTLAARLAGVSETLEMTISEPAFVHQLLEKCAVFLTSYLRAFARAGADGVIMAEPMAGLLSPAALAEFSSAYIKPMGQAMADGQFGIILHNCGATLRHLPAILATDLKCFHFGAPMNLASALEQVPAEVVLCGNLDPSAVFVQLPPTEITSRATALLEETATHRNFVLSSGCDLPPGTRLSSVEALYAAARMFNEKRVKP